MKITLRDDVICFVQPRIYVTDIYSNLYSQIHYIRNRKAHRLITEILEVITTTSEYL